jgi:hypothetical protein
MGKDKLALARRVLEHVQDGTIPESKCANCGNPDAKQRSFYAVCERAERSFQQEGGGFWVGMFGLLRPSKHEELNKLKEIRKGEDVVVPVPLSICKECDNALYGGDTARLISMTSQLFLLGGFGLLAAWVVSQIMGGPIRFLWIAIIFGIAILINFPADFLQSRWRRQLFGYLNQVPEYGELLEAYPETELFATAPTELLSSAETGQGKS